MNIATILFVYNRPIHTQKTLNALRDNTVKPCELFVFHDGKKTSTDENDWNEVERIIRTIDWCDHDVITSPYNKGLANSIIDGVNMVFETHDAIIVLEDDCVPNRLFMEYMTGALEKYMNEEKVYSIGAWAEPIDVPANGYDAFFVGRINSCGWGTWKDKWKVFRRDYNLLREIKKDKSISEWLNVWGQDLEWTLHRNMDGYFDTWAAFWALSVILHKGLSLSPYYSLIDNIGFDGTGRHSSICDIDNRGLKSEIKKFNYPNEIKVIDDYINVFANYYPWTNPEIRESYYKLIMLRWYDCVKQGKNITDWLTINNIKTICIWGLGEVGKRLYSALSGVCKIEAIIETTPESSSYNNTLIMDYKKIYKIGDSIDCILVVPGYDIERISRLVDKRIKDKLVPINRLFEPNVIECASIYNVTPKHMGDKYGGYNIYDNIVPDGAIVYSVGIGENVTFDEEIIMKKKAKVFAFDPTPKAETFINSTGLKSNNSFNFYNYGISSKNQIARFYLPQNKDYVSGSEILRSELDEQAIEVVMKDIYTIARELRHNHIDVLKMDIEGSEFSVIESLKETTELIIEQICLETHQRFFENDILLIEKMNSRLNELGYVLLFVSENYENFTYVREEKLKGIISVVGSKE